SPRQSSRFQPASAFRQGFETPGSWLVYLAVYPIPKAIAQGLLANPYADGK
ncbi:hypothetical protein IM676_03090, partial [Anabaenopsis elenkinii CCIBt3563]